MIVERLHVKLFSPESLAEFKVAIRRLAELRAGGWVLSSIDEGFLGGLSAGHFVLTQGTIRETIPFRLDPESLKSFREAINTIDSLPAQRRTITSVTLDKCDGRPAALLVIEETTGVRAREKPLLPPESAPRRA